MGIQINGQTDSISAIDGSFSIQDLAEVNVTGVATASNFKTGTSNVHSTGYDCANINATGIVTAASANFTGNVSVGGTLTYQDVTNIDSVGIVTARAGVHVTGGNVAVGHNNPSVNLHVKGSASNGQIYLGGTGAHSQIYADNDGVLILNADQGNSAANSYLGFNVDNTERLRISSNGAVCIGSGYQSSGGGQLTIRGLGVNSYAVQDYQYVGTPSGGTTLSQIRFTANTSGSSVIGGARIQAAADDDWSATGDAPTRLQFYTTPNGSSSQAERLRIDSNGRQYHYTDGSLRMHLNATGLGVNTTTITGGRLIHAHNTGTGSAYFQSTNSNTGEGSSSGALFGVSGTTCYAPWNYINGPVVFATNASEKMRIHATGEVTKSSQPLAIIGTTQNNWVPSAGDVLPFNYTNTNRGNHYNTSNYTFTCPVAGDYMVILRLSRKGFRGDLELAKNNGQYALLELRETGRNNSSAADWQAWCYDFIVPCAANDTLKWKAPNVYTGTGGGNYLLDGLNHIYYDSVTYYLMG